MHNLDSLWDCDTVFRSIELSIMVRTPDLSDPVRHINWLVSRKYSVLPRIISLDYKSVSLAPFWALGGCLTTTEVTKQVEVKLLLNYLD